VAAHLSAALSLWGPAAVRTRASVNVAAAVRPVTLKLLAACGAATLMARTEPVGGASTRLTNGELWDLACRRRYAADLWKRRANERTMNGPFLVVATLVVRGFFTFVGVLGLRVFERLRHRDGLRFGN
jgi:hypothetical protein